MLELFEKGEELSFCFVNVIQMWGLIIVGLLMARWSSGFVIILVKSKGDLCTVCPREGILIK